MLESFKIVVLCLICTIITAIFSTVLLTAILFIILIIIFYDFNFDIPFERHAINKVKHAYFKVRNVFYQVYPNLNYTNHYIYSPNMSNINKQQADFDLSKFNRSGSVFSPISRIGGSGRRMPTQTSTPLTRNSPWQKNSSTPVKAMTFQNSTISRSPRYSLSSNDLNEVKNSSQSPAVQTVAGPLLASTRFNINLGMYTDTKSPGLVNRIVQYHNESQSNEAQTHQSKYKSPGQFPIVQLYKKKLPLLTRTPKRCTVRVAPPDCVTYNSPEGNKILKDTFVQRNNTDNNNTDKQQPQSETEMYTKSVLDALKEISRKRIHANDDLDDLSKRQRKGSVSCISTDNTNKDGKRLREDTPPKPKGTPTSPTSNKQPKKICVTNEIECSLSSSILMRMQGQKRKAGRDNVITNTVKQRRISGEMEKNGNHISRQTQTPVSESNSNSKSISHSTQTNFSETNDKNSSNTSKNETTPKKQQQQQPNQKTEEEYTGLQQILQNAKRKKKQYFEKSIEEIDDERSSVQFNNSQPYKPLFAQQPMEIIMKNRLEVAMAALNGEKPELTPIPKLTLTEMLEKKKEEARNETENVLKEAKALTSILSPKNKSKHDKHVSFDIPNDKDTEKTPDKQNDDKVDSSKPESNQNEPKTPEKPPNQPLGPQISFGPITSTTGSNNTSISTPNVKDSPQPTIQFKFGENTQTSDTQKEANQNPSSTLSKSPSNLPTFNFGAPNPSGIKFGDTSKSAPAFGSPSTATTQSTITFGGSVTASSGGSFGGFGTPISAPKVSEGVSKSSPPVTQSPPASSTQSALQLANPNLNFGNKAVSFGAPISNAPTFGATTTSTVTFGASIATTSASTGFSFGNKTESSAPSFGNKTDGSAPAFGNKTEGSVPTFAFGQAKSPPKTGGFKFDLGKSTSTTSEAPKSFGDNKPTFSFGGSAPAFGAATTASSFAGTTSAAPSFGANTTTAPSFGGSSTTAPTFGGTASAVPSFGGAASGSSFGGTTSALPVFGGNSSTTSAPSFGTTTTTASSVFGEKSNEPKPIVFGSNTTSPFGGNTNTTTASSVFGSFGAPKTESSGFNFGQTTQSSTFGNFSAPTTQSSGFNFGGTPNPTSTTAVSTSSNTFTFGGASQNKPFNFSASTTSNNVFGGTNTPTFGSPANNSGVFGAPTTTSSNVFGAPSTTSQVTNVFGSATTSTSVFGGNTATTTASGFGSTNSNNVFGSGSTNFGSNANTGSVFGQSNQSFGNSANNNSFGAPNQAPFGSGAASGVFGGNSSGTSNVFGSPNAAKPAFGSSAPSFGGSFGNSAPSFNTTTQPSNAFGSNATTTNTFGSANNNNNTNNNQSSGGFGSFGAPSVSAGPQGGQGGIFTFGQGAAAGSNSQAFQFGASSAPAKPSGFNFSGNTTTPNLNFTAGNQPPAFGASPAAPPPAFGQQPNAMFSIGSGSTAPKQRTIIKARRRNNN